MLSNQFAFTIIDDTDHATLENVKPIYDLLAKLGIRITKTVWPLHCDDPKNPFGASATLEDTQYAQWIKSLHDNGFEIAFHGASAGSNMRDKTQKGLDKFLQVVGRLPTMHINHHLNRDNLYWGATRIDSPTVRFIMKHTSKHRNQSFEGHNPVSKYFWGDIAHQQIRYCRNLVFVNEINIQAINPTIPYHDPKRAYVPRWFSASDGGDPRRFLNLLRPQNMQKLVKQHGVCIVYTHFGSGFVINGKVRPDIKKVLSEIAAVPNAYFAPATELLDKLCVTNKAGCASVLSEAERQVMEYTWLKDKVLIGGTS